MKRYFLPIAMSLSLMACTHTTYVVNNNSSQGTTKVETGNGNASSGTSESNSIRVKLPEVGGDKLDYMPNATAFRMSGDFSKNVAITLGPDGGLLYFPDPKDISADSEPISLGDGWWLNCQGLNPNSVFTNYTFAEYASLPAVPTIEQLKASVIPGAKVTQFIELPFKQAEMLENINLIKEYLKNN